MHVKQPKGSRYAIYNWSVQALCEYWPSCTADTVKELGFFYTWILHRSTKVRYSSPTLNVYHISKTQFICVVKIESQNETHGSAQGSQVPPSSQACAAENADLSGNIWDLNVGRLCTQFSYLTTSHSSLECMLRSERDSAVRKRLFFGSIPILEA